MKYKHKTDKLYCRTGSWITIYLLESIFLGREYNYVRNTNIFKDMFRFSIRNNYRWTI